MLSFETSQTHFLFNGKLFDQINHVAMGSPLSPVLANLFLGHHENIWLENYQAPVLFYRRYVDDTFCVFHTEKEAASFFDFLSSQNANITFTMEKKPIRFWLSLLRVLISMILLFVGLQPIGKKLLPDCSHFFSDFFSYKVGLIRILLDRAYKINSSLLLFNNDVKNLTHIFKRNQCPENLVNKVIKAYLDNNVNSVQSEENDSLNFKLLYLPFSNFAQRKVRTT